MAGCSSATTAPGHPDRAARRGPVRRAVRHPRVAARQAPRGARPARRGRSRRFPGSPRPPTWSSRASRRAWPSGWASTTTVARREPAPGALLDHRLRRVRRDADRPAIDALVAARTGQQFERRGVVGGTIGRLSGAEVLPGSRCQKDAGSGADGRSAVQRHAVDQPRHRVHRDVGINAALGAREITGRASTCTRRCCKACCATTGAPGSAPSGRPRRFKSWVIDPRAPKGLFQGSDGRWTHHWVPLPGFILSAGDLERLEAGPDR